MTTINKSRGGPSGGAEHTNVNFDNEEKEYEDRVRLGSFFTKRVQNYLSTQARVLNLDFASRSTGFLVIKFYET